MKNISLLLPLLFLSLLTAARPLHAGPTLTSVFPFSCQRGQEVEVTVSGKELGDATALVFSVPGITAKALGKGRFLVSVPADVRPRECDVWCIAGDRMSDPRRFVISSLPCAAEQSGNDGPEQAQKVPLPGAVDGRLEAAARIDWFQFAGKRDQSVSLFCRSLTLDGSVAPALTLFGPDGRELAYSHGRRREPIVTLTLPADGTYRVRINDRAYQKNDQSHYRLELLDGQRVAGCFPQLLGGDTADVVLFGFELAEAAPGGIVGSRAALTRMSFKLPAENRQGPLAWQPASTPFPHRSLHLPAGSSGSAAAAFVDRPVTVEVESGTSSLTKSQPLELPVLLNGRFDELTDIDWYSFSAKKNETIHIELSGDRLGRAMDLDATILDATGKTLTTLPDLGTPKDYPPVLSDASLDVSADWKPPADGEYRLVIRDLFGGSLAGAGRAYVLHVHHNRPAVRVFAVPAGDQSPAGLTLPQAGHAAWRLFAERRNGFGGAVQIVLDESAAPAGVTLDECWIGPGETSALALFTAAPDAPRGPSLLRLEARAEAGGEMLTLPVRITTPLTGSIAAGRLVGRAALHVAAPDLLNVALECAAPTVKAGETLSVTVRRRHLTGTWKGAAKVEFPVLPGGVKKPDITLKPDDETVTVELPLPKKLAAGRYTLAAVVSGTVVAEPTDQPKGADKSKGEKKPQETPIRSWTNAITFEVTSAE